MPVLLGVQLYLVLRVQYSQDTRPVPVPKSIINGQTQNKTHLLKWVQIRLKSYLGLQIWPIYNWISVPDTKT